MFFTESPAAAPMGVLLGLMAAAAVLIFVARTLAKPWISAMTAMICAALSAYSWQQGAWPVAVIAAVWVIVVLRRDKPPARSILERRSS